MSPSLSKSANYTKINEVFNLPDQEEMGGYFEDPNLAFGSTDEITH